MFIRSLFPHLNHLRVKTLDSALTRKLLPLYWAFSSCGEFLQRNRLQISLFCRSLKKLKFTDASFQSLGLVDLPPETPPDIPLIYITLDVISVDVPAFIGLGATELQSVTSTTVHNEPLEFIVLHSRAAAISALTNTPWDIPLVRQQYHVYTPTFTANYCFFSQT